MEKIRLFFIYSLIPAYYLGGGYSFYSFKYIFIPILLINFFLLLLKKKIKIRSFIIKENSFFLFLVLYGFLFLIINEIDETAFTTVAIQLNALILMIVLLMDINIRAKIILNLIKLTVPIMFFHSLFNNFSGPYSNPNIQSFVFVSILPYLLYSFNNEKKITHKLITLCCVLLTIIGPILAYSRFNIFALFLILLLYFYHLIYKKIKTRYKRLLILFFRIMLLFILPLVIIYIVNLNSYSITEQLTREGGSLYYRIQLIKEGLDLFIESNFLGIGVHLLSLDLPFRSFHNVIIFILARYGIISFSFFIYMILRLGFIAFKSKKKNINVFLLTISILIITLIAANSPAVAYKIRPFYFNFTLLFLILREENCL